MSKTVKRVSKTVKRVMTVMMVGLLAMLGDKAEAHYFWFFGKIKFCSVCSDGAGLNDVPGDPAVAEAVAELIVETKLVGILCPNAAEVVVEKQLTLVGEAPVVSSGPLNFVVSDQPFEQLGFCGNELPEEVRILKMSVQYNAYECTGSASNLCSSKVLVSTMKAKKCRLQPDDNFVCAPYEFTHEL